MIVGGGGVMIRYSLELTRSQQFRFFGVACIGLIFVYSADLHYPTFFTHGPIEIFLIVAGSLASLNGISRNLSKNTSNVTEPTGNLLGAFDPIRS